MLNSKIRCGILEESKEEATRTTQPVRIDLNRCLAHKTGYQSYFGWVISVICDVSDYLLREKMYKVLTSRVPRDSTTSPGACLKVSYFEDNFNARPAQAES